jgi:hypothetical protein
MQQQSGSSRTASAQPSRVHTKHTAHEATAGVALPLDKVPLNEKLWKRHLKDIISHSNWRHGVLHKIVSNKTMHERESFYFRSFQELRDHGYKLDPRSLGNRHIKFLVKCWVKRELKPATIQTYLSFLSVFATWIGKNGLVMEPQWYVDDPALVTRSYVATNDKSWCANGVEANQIIARIAEYDAHAAAQLDIQSAFGFRVKESVMFRPHESIVPSTKTGVEKPLAEFYVQIDRGTKGGRVRYVAIDTTLKKAAIERARSLAPAPDSHIGYPGLTLKQSMRRLYYVLEKFGITRKQLGVTAHGLRHQYANDRFEAMTGVLAPLRAGPAISPESDTAARLAIAEDLGHARQRISNAYLGSSATTQGSANAPTPSNANQTEP